MLSIYTEISKPVILLCLLPGPTSENEESISFVQSPCHYNTTTDVFFNTIKFPQKLCGDRRLAKRADLTSWQHFVTNMHLGGIRIILTPLFTSRFWAGVYFGEFFRDLAAFQGTTAHPSLGRRHKKVLKKAALICLSKSRNLRQSINGIKIDENISKGTVATSNW